MSKALKILGLFVLVFATIFILMTARNLYLVRTGGIVKWDNKWYTKKELAEKFPSQYYEVEAKNTPEEAYAGFRQALLENDIEKALEYVVEEKREMYREAFQDQNKLEKVKLIPEVDKIMKSEKNSYDNFSNYYYERDGDFFEIDFLKNEEGFWMISGI
jgi:hypothetical protein